MFKILMVIASYLYTIWLTKVFIGKLYFWIGKLVLKNQYLNAVYRVEWGNSSEWGAS